MPRASQVCTCVFCPHLSNLARLVSSLISQCAGAFSATPSDAGTSDSRKNPSRMKPPNGFEPVALFLNLLASVFSIIVSILRLLEMTNQR